jgi:hypothetical protein
MKYHITTKIKRNDETVNRSIADYTTENLLTCNELKALVKSTLNYPFEVEKEIIVVKNKEIEDGNQIIENVSNIEYKIYYKK